MNERQIRDLLAKTPDPISGMPLFDSGVEAEISVADNKAAVCFVFPYPAKTAFARVAAECAPALKQGGVDAAFSFRQEIHARTTQGGVARLAGVKNIVAVSSAKGGVGKSTTAANLALALAGEGARVGVLDADVYGPSFPALFGVSERPKGAMDGGMSPVSAHGVQLISVGFLVDKDQAMVWRGPVATRAVTQLMRETAWNDVDYLILDMPPGTGDIQLTVAQQIPVAGAVVITTPQELAVADARRGIAMFNKVSIPVLGVVENMTAHVCPHCGKASNIFGEGGARALCNESQVELLGQLPLAAAIRDAADKGAPTVAANPDGAEAREYIRIALRVAHKLCEKTRDRSAAFPQIVVSE